MTPRSEVSRHATPVALPSRVGQGTAVEQSRAVAEVQAAIVVARQFPRDTVAAVNAMRDSCSQMGLATRAFYSYTRGGQLVDGATIHLARELARCWGNIQYGVAELRRDDDFGQSEMLAFAWDVQTNTRPTSTFIVPHFRDKTAGPERLTAGRDIYENNANNGARRVRELIFAVLPTHYVVDAQNLCRQTLENGGGVPLTTRVADCVAAFEAMGVTPAQLEKHTGRKPSEWSAQVVAQMGITYTSIINREVRLSEVFEAEEEVTADAIAAQAARRGRRPAKAAEPVDAEVIPMPDEQPEQGEFDASVQPGFGTDGGAR